MKQVIVKFGFPLIISLLFSFCGNSQDKTVEKAKETQAAIKKNRPGTISTTEDGWSMKAKINGKHWMATSIMPPDATGRIVGYYEEEYIGLPYDRRDFVVGKKITFGENNAVDLSINNDARFYGGRKGEMEITKVGDKWAEGRFFFTATASGADKAVDVTEGFFRISLEKNQQ